MVHMSIDRRGLDLASRALTGPPAQRLAQAREVAEHLDGVLANVERGELQASGTEVARMQGAAAALRMVAGE